jgi:single-strand DNA-binding protein
MTCRLTKDPEVRSTPSGQSICSLRVAYSTRRKDQSGNWGDKSNYLDVTVFGNQGERVAQYLSKGKRIGVDGRLEWREWQTDSGEKRQAYEVVADSVVFLDSKGDSGDGGQGTGTSSGGGDFQGADDDIPF